ncbi:MAG: hypothetical protein C5B50_04300 [Verrucomicrobia bacterium]|nr:MAG: hypothetical protein C5B50_04300 [Verrucomicrobiota bacterium]
MKTNALRWAVAFGLLAAAGRSATAEPTLKIGDPAPKLAVSKWVQGEPVTKFEKGKAYLVEFWATWCGPCRVSIPHLNEIHAQFKDKGLIVIGQDCWEKDETLVAPFVARMGDKMTYRVALDDKEETKTGKMSETWMAAAGQHGIPTAFLVDTSGFIAWIGHPMGLNADVIEDVLSGKFDRQKAAQEYADTQQKQVRLQTAFSAVNKAMRDKQWDEAMNKVEEYAKLVPPGPQKQMTTDMLRLNVLFGKEDYPAAFDLVKKVSDANSTNGPLQNGLAWRLITDKGIKQRNLPLAETLASRANDATQGTNGIVLDTLARIKFLRGDQEKAVALEEKAVGLTEGEQRDRYESVLKKYKRGESPEIADELRARASQEAMTGKWKAAAADYARLIESEPDDHMHYHSLAPLLVQLGDMAGYERHRQRVLAQFGSTTNPVIAERMAKDCFLLPWSGPDAEKAGAMADRAVSLGKDHTYFLFFEFAKALAEYRQGHFAKAVTWSQKVLDEKQQSSREAQTYMVLAMAQYRLDQVEHARAALAKGLEISGKMPGINSAKLGPDWNDVLIVHALETEARRLIEAGKQLEEAEK